MIAHSPTEIDKGGGARVELRGVRRAFAKSGPVIEPLDLVIQPGEFISLLGPSGCGKSTLLRLIAGLDSSDDGEIKVDSRGRKFYRGFVFQEAHLLPWRTVLQNAALPLELTGASKSEARDMAREALMRVGLGDALTRYPNQLSGGMKMRVSVARALVAQPTLLLLDEPFAALDEHTRFRLQEDLRSLWENLGMTVVFVTHSVSEAVFLSGRSILFSRRPARLLLDHRVDLPRERNARLRTDPKFLQQVELIQSSYDHEEETA